MIRRFAGFQARLRRSSASRWERRPFVMTAWFLGWYGLGILVRYLNRERSRSSR